jgi:hypothetical protein
MTTPRCPRCGGNLRLEREDGGWELDCLQCGYRRGLGEAAALPHVMDCKLGPNKAESPIVLQGEGQLKPGGRPIAKLHYHTPQVGSTLKATKKESRWALQRRESPGPRLKPGAHHQALKPEGRHRGGSKYG